MARRPPFRTAALLLGVLGIGYGWGHYGVTRGLFPYPQIVEARRAATGEMIDERPAYQREPPMAYRETASFYEVYGKPADLVIVGDSMLARAPWRDLLPERDVANRAIPGDFAAWLPRRLDPVVATEADQAIVMIGLNDAVEGRDAKKIHRDILKVVKRLSAEGMAVTVVSPLPCAATAEHCGNASAIVAEIGSLLTLNSGAATFVDLAPRMAPDGHLLDRFTLDGVHFNRRGFETLLAQLR